MSRPLPSTEILAPSTEMLVPSPSPLRSNPALHRTPPVLALCQVHRPCSQVSPVSATVRPLGQGLNSSEGQQR